MRKLLQPKGHVSAFIELVSLLTTHRQLTWEMAKREVRDRYAGQAFGLFWSFGHPLILTLIYLYIFGFVFNLRFPGEDRGADFTIYLLSGLIPWICFQEVLGKSSQVIIANASLVKQVIFPIEILPVKGVLPAIFNQLIMIVLLMVYAVYKMGTPPLFYALLPILVLIQALAMIGSAYILSAVGAYFRDIKDFIQIFIIVGIFSMPIFYQVEQVPKAMRIILYINPFSHLIFCYRDILYHARIEHPYSWMILIGGALFTFVFGYRIFRSLKSMFGNVL